ncbi:hypothetical protein EV643_108196 [Kribbella sp. VKM Ac-2527]|uniref:Immunity protein 35 of polymorphic toxin system n=1 Tax=Kribbella caucasensis TaxID=2512215 RepID=A0A4R6KC89_9ACTN|nr:hypothetical protein [Kribbella sp. VKM Ac-2527]TDO47882.1 hypothetical protein EV643_108196 [Kribbella sp. VKM Ac-2527]
MADEIDQAVLAQARQRLADWMNDKVGDDPQLRTTAESYDDWQVGSYEEFLIFSSPGGFTNQLYMVGDGVVQPFSYTRDDEESAAEKARAQRDGLTTPEAQG